MHMAMVMGAGVLLLVVFVMFGWLWGASAAGMVLAAKVFVPVGGIRQYVGGCDPCGLHGAR